LRNKAQALFLKVYGGRDKWEREVREASRTLNHALGLKVYDRREKAIINFVLEHAGKIPKEDTNGI
jgi:hypothetical protein